MGRAKYARPKGWDRPRTPCDALRDSMPSTSVAEELAKKQREISVSEFFERNKQILGYDSPTKALLTAVKEAVDNSLDACQDADILPDVLIEIDKIDKDEFVVKVEDNGPGIVKREVANVFGRLLYGSRFFSLQMRRGQQGLGVGGAIRYGQVTTGKPTLVRTRTAEMDVGYELELIVDTRRNKPSVQRDKFVTWDKPHGTRVEIPLKGRYISSKQGPLEYARATAIVNPHARVVFKGPGGESIVFERATEELPPKTVEIKPHPYGIELGTFLAAAKKILDAIKGVKIMAPPTDCLSPIGEKLIKKGLNNVLGSLKPEFYSQPLTRDPAVWQGNPFQVEVGI